MVVAQSLNHSVEHSASYHKILEASIPLFADKGFDGVSMRDIARAVGIKAPALYNHFDDKQTLYLAVISHAFANKADNLIQTLSSIEEPEKKLEQFITQLTRMMAEDDSFRHLLQRELLDGDEQRLKILGSEVFAELFLTARNLFKQLYGNCCDPGLLAITAIGMIRQHFELQPLYQYLPGNQQKNIDPDCLSKHVMNVLLHGIRG